MDSKKQAKKVKKWIQKAGIEAILSLDNFFPQQSTQVLAVHSGRQREVVPWAEVQRGGQPAVHLYIDANHSLTDFYADWTLTHEMSHLYLPFIDYNHRWFSEGVASYYQNILRGRNGLLTPEQAWERLIAGFHRGKKASGIRSLAQTNAIMQMYWGGAALIFLADVQLRQLNPPQSMDQALNLLSQCCLQPNQYWSIQRIIQTLDQLSQSKIFSTLYFQWADSRKFPEVEETLNQLGIRRLGRSVVIDPKAPLATIATDMMRSRYQTQ